MYNIAMKKVELLSPAGNYEKALIAINNGADALYLAYEEFGARAYADNFDEENLKSIVDYAHLLNVKIYVTFNTLIFNSELEQAKKVIDKLYRLNVDALIIQDLGILNYVRSNYPDFECHGSTQMHIYNKDSLEFLKNLGVTRAVLARECDVDKIKSFNNIDIEKEVFVHGSLCVSYSGQCLISALNFNRSGNKGMCAQSCRMQYDLIDSDNNVIKHGYLLSPKDMMSITHMQELLNAGIDSFKIEGRMKSNEYVGMVTRLYRRGIDNCSNQISVNELKRLKTIYNREYTLGHLYNQKGDKLVNHYRPNHLGIPIGKVIKVDNKKFSVKLTDQLSQHDGIRIIQNKHIDTGFIVNKMYNQKGKLINCAKKGDIVSFDKKENIQNNAMVVKTSSKQVIDEENIINNTVKSLPLDLKVKIEVNSNIVINMQVASNDYTYVSEVIPQLAQNRAISDENIEKAFTKLKGTNYYLNTITIDNDDSSFLPISKLNEVRRDMVDYLNNLRLLEFKRTNHYYKLENNNKNNKYKDSKYIVSVLSEEQCEACKQFDNLVVVSDNEQLVKKYGLQKISSNVYDEKYDDITVVSDLGGIKEDKILDYHLNICNEESLELLEHYNIEGVILSIELSDEEIINMDFNNYHYNIGKYIYGKPKVMSMKYCPVNHCILNNDKNNCRLCKNKAYYLKDLKDRKFYLRGDDNCIMHIYNDFKIDKIDKIDSYKKQGINLFRIEFSDENYFQAMEVLKKIT